MSLLTEQIQVSFAPLLGIPCWQVRRGYGSFLTFEFGEPHLEIREPREAKPTASPRVRELLARRRVFIHGEWHLWIYCCNWIVTKDGKCVGESSSHERMDRAAATLDGQALTQVNYEPSSGCWIFDFDLGGCLATERYDESGEQWHLSEPSGQVLTVRANGSFSHTPENEPYGDTSPLDPLSTLA